MDGCTFVVAQSFRDHDVDPAMREFCAVTYAGSDVAAAIEAVQRPVLSVLVRLYLWRDGACAERWERLVPPNRMALQRQVRSLEVTAPRLGTLASPWRLSDRIVPVEDFGTMLEAADRGIPMGLLKLRLVADRLVAGDALELRLDNDSPARERPIMMRVGHGSRYMTPKEAERIGNVLLKAAAEAREKR